MKMELQVVFFLFLSLAACQDLRYKRIDIWIYLVFGSIALGFYLIEKDHSLLDLGCRISIGLALLGVHKFTEDGVGEGDGWFFLISGIYLGFWYNLALLLYGLILCCLWGFGMVAWGLCHQINIRKYQLPFLPFIVPAAFWVVFV